MATFSEPIPQVREVVDALSAQILAAMRHYAMEYKHPTRGADESEASMKEAKARIDGLRKLRREYEDLMMECPYDL